MQSLFPCGLSSRTIGFLTKGLRNLQNTQWRKGPGLVRFGMEQGAVSPPGRRILSVTAKPWLSMGSGPYSREDQELEQWGPSWRLATPEMEKNRS